MTKLKQKKTKKFLKEFTAFIFLAAIVLAMFSPLALADDPTTGQTGTTDSGSTAGQTGATDSDATTGQFGDTTPAGPTPGTTVIQPGAGKEDAIFIPLDTTAYKEFPKLTQTSPTGMLAEFFGGLVRNAKWILGGLAVLFIGVSAVKLIVAGNSEDVVTKQKSAIIYAIIGLVVIGFADDVSRVLSVACAPGETECARGGFLQDPQNIIQQAALFKQTTRIFITFIKYLIGGVAVLMLVRNGIRLIGLAGNEESIGLDKKNLIYTSVGLVLIIVASTFIDKVLFIVDPARYSSMTGVQPAISPAAGISEVIGFTNMAVLFISPIAILMLIVGAVMYATAGGNEERMNKAKRLIILSIAGMVLIYGAFAVVSTIVAGKFNP
ncbi:hypothetical protein ACFLZH_04950 [Patescibacteria group bacterium]